MVAHIASLKGCRRWIVEGIKLLASEVSELFFKKANCGKDWCQTASKTVLRFDRNAL